MNLLLLCMASVFTKCWVLANPLENCDDGRFRVFDNEILQVDLDFQRAGLVPDVIPTSPPAFLRIRFDASSASLGNYISPLRTLRTPRFNFMAAEPATYYTIVVFDPDYPSALLSYLKQGLIYLSVNFVDVGGGDLSDNDIIAPWVSIFPPPGSDKHRIVGLIYKQPDFINPDNRPLLNLGRYRVRFNLEEFVATYNLVTPVGGNYWRTSVANECYCTNYPYAYFGAAPFGAANVGVANSAIIQ